MNTFHYSTPLHQPPSPNANLEARTRTCRSSQQRSKPRSILNLSKRKIRPMSETQFKSTTSPPHLPAPLPRRRTRWHMTVQTSRSHGVQADRMSTGKRSRREQTSGGKRRERKQKRKTQNVPESKKKKKRTSAVPNQRTKPQHFPASLPPNTIDVKRC